MLNFNFYNPTRIIFGKGEVGKLNELIPSESKVLIVYDKIIENLGILDEVKVELLRSKRTLFTFSEIEPNPEFSTLMKAVGLVRRENVDFLLAIGGGSIMDGTKFIGIASATEEFIGREDELLKLSPEDPKFKGAIPLGTIPTLPATGSEMNPHAVISNGSAKLGITSKYCFPQFSILDPEYTYSLPKHLLASGIADSFIHVAEQYVTYPVNGRFQDRTAEGIMKTLIEVGEETIKNPENYEARANLMWCATMALNGLIGSGVPQDFTAHMIGHEVTSLLKIAHGPSLSIIQPAVWKVRKEEKKEKLVQLAERVWGISKGTDDEKVDLAIEKTEDFFRKMGLKTRFTEYGLVYEEVKPVLNLLEDHNMVALSERGDIDLKVSEKILKEAM